MLYFGHVLHLWMVFIGIMLLCCRNFSDCIECLVYFIIGKCEIGIYCGEWILYGYVSSDIGGCWVVSHSQPRVPGAWDAGARQVVSERKVWKPWVLREVGSECFGLR